MKAVGRVMSGDGPVDKHKAAQAQAIPVFVISLASATAWQVGVSHDRRNDANAASSDGRFVELLNESR